MIVNEENQLIILDNIEGYLLSGSVNELGGPYHSRFSEHLFKMHKDEYSRIWDEACKNNRIFLKDIPLALETLHLLIYEMSDGDFAALYDNVTKVDVSALYDKLEKISQEASAKNA